PIHTLSLHDALPIWIRRLDDIGNPTLAFLASGIEGLKLRITAKAGDEASALELVAVEEAELRALLGDIVFGVDHETMEHAVGVLDRKSTRLNSSHRT